MLNRLRDITPYIFQILQAHRHSYQAGGVMPKVCRSLGVTWMLDKKYAHIYYENVIKAPHIRITLW